MLQSVLDSKKGKIYLGNFPYFVLAYSLRTRYGILATFSFSLDFGIY